MSRQSESNVLNSVCPLDCPDTCSLAVTVEGDRLIDIRGSKANPYTANVVCEKVAKYYPDFVHGAKRLRYPLARRGGKRSALERVSWAQAIDRIHAGLSDALAQFGPQSVLPLNYAGPHGQLAYGSMDRRFFHRLGASLLDRGPLCGAVRGAAYTSVYGNSPGMSPHLAAEADVVAVWGNNVTVSNLHFARVLQQVRQQGGKVIVIDPKRTRIAEQAQLFIQIRPGTDVVLAMALAAECERRGAFDSDFIDRWVEGVDEFMSQARTYGVQDVEAICGVSATQFDQLAECYVGARRLSVSIGNGIERGRSGGSGLRAIISLNALLGQCGREGAGVIAKPGLSFPHTAHQLQRPDVIPPGTRTINIVDVGALLTDTPPEPPLKALFIYNHNPVCTHPDQNRLRRGLAREDLFVAGADVVMTDSMACCDVVLPACSHFEYHDIYSAYGHSYLQRAEPVIPPVGESLPNTEIFRRLAARFGFDEPMFVDDDKALMDAAMDAGDPRMKGHVPSELPLEHALLMTSDSGEPLLTCGNIAPATASGKVELFSRTMQTQFGFGVPRYEAVTGSHPLMLITPSSSKRTNATFGGHAASQGLEQIEIHPDDAARRSIAEGDEVRVFNALGEVVLRAALSRAVRPGVLYSPKGTWLNTSPTGQTVNALLDADLRTDIMDGACYNDTFVELERV